MSAIDRVRARKGARLLAAGVLSALAFALLSTCAANPAPAPVTVTETATASPIVQTITQKVTPTACKRAIVLWRKQTFLLAKAAIAALGGDPATGSYYVGQAQALQTQAKGAENSCFSSLTPTGRRFRYPDDKV